MNPRHGRWAAITIVGLALVLRVLAALRLGPHIDEAESVLAGRMVATMGFPTLPSGVVFLQGFTLSYLLPLFDRAPDPLDLTFVRLPSVLAGTAAVAAVMPLARRFGASPTVALFVALALATDPASLQWSGHVRPYAMLQLETIGILCLWLDLLDAPSLRRSLALVGLFALAVFTHVGVVLILPAMGLCTWHIVGRDLWAGRRDLTLTLSGFGFPLLAFALINATFGVTTSGADTARPGFIGDHLLSLANLQHPDLDVWQTLFQHSGAHDFVLYMLVFCSAVLLLRRPDVRTFALLVSYALPVLGVAAFTVEAQPRYLLHLHPLGWIILGMGIAELWHMPTHVRAWRGLAGVGVLVCALHFGDGASYRLTHPSIDPDYTAALRWLTPQHAPGEPILVAITSVTRLSTLPQEDVYFLAGPADAPRTTRYTRRQPDGRLTDYWSGVPAIPSTDTLCRFLAEHPGTWLILDAERLHGDWAFAGPMESVIEGAANLRANRGGAMVYRGVPPEDWTPKARSTCALAAVREQPPT